MPFNNVQYCHLLLLKQWNTTAWPLVVPLIDFPVSQGWRFQKKRYKQNDLQLPFRYNVNSYQSCTYVIFNPPLFFFYCNHSQISRICVEELNQHYPLSLSPLSLWSIRKFFSLGTFQRFIQVYIFLLIFQNRVSKAYPRSEFIQVALVSFWALISTSCAHSRTSSGLSFLVAWQHYFQCFIGLTISLKA